VTSQAEKKPWAGKAEGLGYSIFGTTSQSPTSESEKEADANKSPTWRAGWQSLNASSALTILTNL
jgi:hypothetical protein